MQSTASLRGREAPSCSFSSHTQACPKRSELLPSGKSLQRNVVRLDTWSYHQRRSHPLQAAASDPHHASEAEREALERRLRESARVEERVRFIYNEQEWQEELDKAGSQLVVLEVESASVCQTGFEEEAELQWKEDQKASLAPCREIKHVLQRTARDCPDITFLALEADSEESQPLLETLGIEVLPTLQFYKDGQKLWEHRGVIQMAQDLGEGVLYYGDAAANGVKASTFVEELKSEAELEQFVNKQGNDVLTVVDISLRSATPCVKIFAAVMALAKNFAGYASFARLIADDFDSEGELVKKLNVVQVPTFLFYRGGKEVGRHVGSSRADLIGKILQLQNQMGIAPPPSTAPVQKRVGKYTSKGRPNQPKVNAWGSS